MRDYKPNTIVSIIVPIFNAGLYLEPCIESILAQTYDNTEIILVDDGSTDSSVGIINNFAERDSRIKVIRKVNAGVSSARNAALDVANGDWVAFVDSDDILPEKSIETMLNHAVNTRANCVCGKFQPFSGTLNRNVSSSIEKNVVLDKKDAISSLLYQREIINAPFSKLYNMKSIGPIRFNEDISVAEDLLFNYYVFKNIEQVTLIDNTTYFYRTHSNSVINKPFSINRMSGLMATKKILTDIQKQDLPILPAVNRYFMEALFISSQLQSKCGHIVFYNNCIDVILEYRKSVLFDVHSPFVYRIFALLSSISPTLSIKVYKAKSIFSKIFKKGLVI